MLKAAPDRNSALGLLQLVLGVLRHFHELVEIEVGHLRRLS